METNIENEQGVEQESTVVGDPDILLNLIEDEHTAEKFLMLFDKVKEIPELANIAAVENSYQRMEQLFDFLNRDAEEHGKKFPDNVEQWACAFCTNWR